jgi:hypothetical protein
MSEDLEKLGRRAASCKAWRWLGGALTIFPPKHEGATGYSIRFQTNGYIALGEEYPDLSDPVTVCSLLVLVREAWGDPTITTIYGDYVDRGEEWSVMVPVVEGRMRAHRVFTGKTPAEVLVDALEAAP